MTDSQRSQSTLIELYRRTIGEPQRTIDVYLGFALFFVAVGIGIVALGVFLYSGQFEPPTEYAWREPAIVMAMASLPLLFLSVIVLLPVDQRGLYAGLAGSAVCLYALVRFLRAYPWQWDTGPVQHSISVTVTYGIGIALLAAATGAALVVYHIARLKRPEPGDIEPAEEDEPAETYSDEEIRRDIEQAMSDVDISWGGIERTETTPLKLNPGDFEMTADGSGVDLTVEEVTSEGVDAQVSGLKSLKGGQGKQARSESTVDDQTERLAQLRERRRQEETAPDDVGLLGSLLGRLGLLE